MSNPLNSAQEQMQVHVEDQSKLPSYDSLPQQLFCAGRQPATVTSQNRLSVLLTGEPHTEV